MVSIIVPVYNTKSEYLYQCIDSILKQTYTDFEILLIDDGSLENTFLECERLSLKDDRINVFHKENGGVSSARNMGLDLAKGEYISFVDSDDWIEPNFIEKLVTEINKNDIDLAVSNLIYDKKNSNLYVNRFDEHKIIELNRDEIFRKMLFEKKIGGFLCNKLFKKALISKGLDIALHYSEDFVFTAEYCQNVCRVIWINSDLYHYRQINSSATNLFTYNKKIITLLDSYKRLEGIYQEELPEELIFIIRNTLKIALNLRSRYLINSINNSNEYYNIINTAKLRFKIVLKSRKINFLTKINIVLTWMSPRITFKLKNKILGRRV